MRYHAWTAQLIRMNHTSVLYAGQIIRVPVVVSASRACTKHRSHKTGLPNFKQPGVEKAWKKHVPKKHHAKPKPHQAKPKAHKPQHPKPKPHAKPRRVTAGTGTTTAGRTRTQAGPRCAG